MSAPENLRTGERRNVTVLFADMKDFTSLSEHMDPEEMDSLMSLVFERFESIIRQYEGSVEKYIGDALVAVFGVPSLHEDDPARAIGAALDFLAEIIRLNDTRRDRPPVAFRIGVNTGLITTGRRGEHDVVTGHAMAVASRLESQASVNSVLVSESTHDRCENDFVFSDRLELIARGKNETVVAYEVHGRNQRLDQDDSIFVGRRPVLDRMLRSFLRHDPTQTEGYIVTGEAGIGKTRLSQEFIRKLRQLPDFSDRILFARARRYGTRPFAVVTDLLSSYFRLESGMTPSTIADIVEREIGVERKTAEGFAALVGGQAQEQENQAFVLLYLVLKSIVKHDLDAPYATLLCVDDLYFMDKSSRDFFQFYLRNADARPFFLFLNRGLDDTFRDTFRALEVIELTPFDREDTLQLIRALAGDDLDIELVNSISENARGNPLFITEYVRYARGNRDAQTLPSSIQNMFLTSIERYPADERDLLKKVAVFAHSFSLEDARHVQSVTDGDPQIVEPAVNRFLREGILVQEDDLFMFKYDLFKTALYNSLLNYNKKILHRVIADLMEQKGHPHPFRLLHHLLRANEYDRATDTLAHAPNATSNVEYLRYVDRLLEHVSPRDFDRHMRLLFVKSAIIFNNGITEEADALLKGMIELAIARQNPLYVGTAYHHLTAYNTKAYCFGKAWFCGTKAIDYYGRAARGAYDMQNLLELIASSELLRNNTAEVNRIVEKIRSLETVEGERFYAPRLAATMAEHDLLRGNYRPAIDQLLRVVTEVEPQSETWYQAQLLLGFGYFIVCDWNAMIAVDRNVLEGPTRHLSNISQTNARMGVACHFLGEGREAERHLQQAEFNASQIRNDFDLIDSLRSLALCYLMIGETQKAKQFATRGLSSSLRHTATYPALTVVMVLVEIALADGDRETAVFHLNEARLLAESGVLLPSRDVALYHYYANRFAEDEETRSRERDLAAQTLQREAEAIGDPALLSVLMRVRNFERAFRDLSLVPTP